MATTIVYGPAGCGKTTNAEKLRKKYHCYHVADGWDPAIGELHARTLALTNADLSTIRKRWPGVTAVAYQDAMK